MAVSEAKRTAGLLVFVHQLVSEFVVESAVLALAVASVALAVGAESVVACGGYAGGHGCDQVANHRMLDLDWVLESPVANRRN